MSQSRSPIHEWPRERIGNVARIVSLDDVRLAQCAAVGIAAEDFDLGDYHSSWQMLPFSSGGPIEEDADESVDVTEGFQVLAMFHFHHVEEDANDNREDEEALDVVASFVLSYSLSQPPTGEHPDRVLLDSADLRAFAEFNSTYNAWPYWREFVHSISARLGLPAVTVPILRVPNLGAPPTK